MVVIDKFRTASANVSGLALAVAASTMLPAFANAQEVTLSSEDNSVSVTGELVSFDGQNFIIRTAMGDLELAAEVARCSGESCPDRGTPPAEFSLFGPKELVSNLSANFIDLYAQKNEANIDKQAISSNESNIIAQSLDDENVLQARLTAADSTASLNALLEGQADFALSTRSVQAREARRFSAAGLGDITDPTQEHILALDGIVIVTSPDNPVNAITQENVARVFAGLITNWRELGGNDAPINVYIRDQNTGTSTVFDQLVMRPAGLEIRKDGLRASTDTSIVESVVVDPNGIGFTSFAGSDEAKSLTIEGVCGLQTPATAFSIQTEEYPLTRLLYAYTLPEDDLTSGNRDFLEFIKSNAAQPAVISAGLIDQEITNKSIDNQGLRLASAIVANSDIARFPELSAMVTELLTAERLSTTFRFETASSRLDPRANQDIDRLADFLRQQSGSKEVILVGFTDSVGDAEQNKLLSKGRAQQVLATLLQRYPDLENNVTFNVSGYGEASPLGCNETSVGRRINRRVEVWMRDSVARN